MLSSHKKQMTNRKRDSESTVATIDASTPIQRRKIDVNLPKATPSEIGALEQSLSPYRRRRRLLLSDLDDESILAILEQMDILSLANFGNVSVFLKALAQSVFADAHDNVLDLCGDQFSCRTRSEFRTVLQAFGPLCKVCLIDMATFTDGFDSASALQWIARYCRGSLGTLALLNFELDLQLNDDPDITELMGTINQLVLAECAVSNGAILFEAGARSLETVILMRTEFDAITSSGFEELTELLVLKITKCNLRNLTMDKVLEHNGRLECFTLLNKAPLPMPAFDRMPVDSLRVLEYRARPKCGKDSTESELVSIGALKNLTQLEVWGYKKLNILPAIERLASHEKLQSLHLSTVHANRDIFANLLKFRQLKALKLERVLTTESLRKHMLSINRMAANGLLELHILFGYPIAMDNLVLSFVIMRSLHTTDVRSVNNYTEAIEMVEDIDVDKMQQSNVIIVWPKGIIWRKNDRAERQTW